MITELTPKQEKGIKEWQKHCLNIGRDTGSINKSVVENSWKKFYKILNKKEPIFWYCQSPLQAQIIINIWPEIMKIFDKDLGSNVESNIWSNIESNIRSNVESNIWSNIESNIWSNIESNIGSNIWSNIRSNIWSNIRSNIWSNIWSNIGSNIWSNIRRMQLNYIETYSWCQHDIEWIAYYKYFEKYGLLPKDENFEIFDIWYDLACSCGWCYTFENIVFVCEKPNELHINESGQLHKDGCMALKYSDGFGLYMLNGVQVPEYLAKTSESELSMDFYNKEKNADVKAEFVRKYGIDRMIGLGSIVDSYENLDNKYWVESEYQLIDMSFIFESLDYAPYLKMKNLTTGIYHLEGVSPECKTINDAIKFRWGGRDIAQYKTEGIK